MRKSLVWGTLTAALVGAALWLGYSGKQVRAQSLQIDRSLLALLPANANTLVGVDVERLKHTSLYQRLEEESRKEKGRNQFDELAAMTGFDPRRDVEQLLVAAWPQGMASRPGEAEPNFLVAGRGRFNAANLTREILKQQAVVEKYRGYDILGPRASGKEPQRTKGKHDQGAVAFLDETTAVAGNRAEVRAAIDRKIGGGPTLLHNTDLLGRAQRISGASQIWAVSQSPGELLRQGLPSEGPLHGSNFARIFQSMQNTSFGLNLTDGLDLLAAGLCRTPEDAKTLADAARGVIALGRLTLSDKEPEWMTVFDRIRVEERGAELDISVSIEREMFEKLLENKGRKKVKAAAQAD